MSVVESQKERIEKLMDREGIKSQVSLLSQILKVNGEKDFYEKAHKKRANFSKMIQGERNFSEEYIAPLEYLLKTTYNYIKNGGKEIIDFNPDGIRYAAFIDDLSYYQRLDAKSDTVFKNSDEFSCTILDYILRYKSKNGIRYLIEQNHIKFDYWSKILSGDIYATNHNDNLSKVIVLLLEIDDFDLFEKFIQSWNSISQVNLYGNHFEKIFSNELLEALGNTKNILKHILSTKYIYLSKINKVFEDNTLKGIFSNPLVELILNYAIKTSNNNLAKKVLMAGIIHNNKTIEYFKNNYNDNESYIVKDDGLVLLNSNVYGSLIVYEAKNQPDVNEEVYKLMHQLNYNINSFSAKSKPLFGGFSNNRLRVIDGKIAKKSSNNEIEYQALKLFKDNNINFVPTLEKQEDGFDYFTYFEGTTTTYVTNMGVDITKELLLLLKQLNETSKKALNGKVYVHGDLWSSNVVVNNNKIVGIIDWNSCHIGEEYEDIIYVLWTWLNIGDPYKNDEIIFQNVKKCLDAYSLDNNLRNNWSNKMIEVMENKLKNTPKDSSDYIRILKWIRESEIWVEIYHDRIKEEIG